MQQESSLWKDLAVRSHSTGEDEERRHVYTGVIDQRQLRKCSVETLQHVLKDCHSVLINCTVVLHEHDSKWGRQMVTGGQRGQAAFLVDRKPSKEDAGIKTCFLKLRTHAKSSLPPTSSFNENRLP